MADYTYRPVEERLRDWNEVYNYNSEIDILKNQAKQCMDCGVPFCQSETGCPVDNLIPEWNKLVSENRWEEAYYRLQNTNNFPEFTGSLCPAPCESACVAGINSDPVKIKSIEWSIIERAFKEGWVKPIKSTKKSGRKVAIVGSGPAGLAAAQQLVRKGHAVTVFEKQNQIGGLLRYGIPDFKIEKWRIDRRINQLIEEGVEFKTSVKIGDDITFNELKSQFDAVGLAMGAETARDLKIPGRHLKGIHLAMDYLIDQNRVNSKEKSELSISAKNKNVIILGGGDTGSDCLGTALRQGAKSVLQIEVMPKPPENRSSTTPWPMWANKLRTSHAHLEGGERLWGLRTLRFEGDGTKLASLVAEKVQFKNGKFEKDHTSSEIHYPVDLVILALGFTGGETDKISDQLGVNQSVPGKIQTYSLGVTSMPGLFAAGDLSRGASLIVWAISEGRKMADGIDRYLNLLVRV